jgi:hypothetical protein
MHSNSTTSAVLSSVSAPYLFAAMKIFGELINHHMKATGFIKSQ